MVSLLVKFEPIFVFIFTCIFCFYLVAKFPMAKKIWSTNKKKRKNTCNNEMKMEVSTLEISVQRRISKSLFIN